MRIKFGFLFLSYLLVSACAGLNPVNNHNEQQTTTTENSRHIIDQLIKNAYQDNTAYEITKSLTMEVGPRLAGSDGDKAAVVWGVNKLTELGFANVYTQDVEVPKWERGETRVEITSPYQQELIATALGGSIGTNGKGLEAEVLMTDTVSTLEEIPDSDVKGKIVFFNRRMQATKDGSGYGIAGKERWEGAQAAVKKGAVALVIRPAGTSHHRFAHTGSMGSYDDDFGRIPAASLTNADADILEYAISNNSELPVILKLTMSAQHLGTDISANVIGELVGTEKPDEIILLGAHLDSWDLGTGAVDDAAGIGIITAAVNLLKQAGVKPKRTLRVVYFANEEFGLSGAKEYARVHAETVNEHIVGMESDFGAGKIWRFASKLPDELLPLKSEILFHLKQLGVEPGDNTTGGGADLGPMRDLGMPTFSFTQDGSKYFHYHHTADDTLDKVDPEELKQNVAVYAVALYFAAMTGLNRTP
jgi:hypothetical protein